MRRGSCSLVAALGAAVVLALAPAAVLARAAAVTPAPLAPPTPALEPQEVRESTVGMPGRLLEVVLPGSELEVAPRVASDPLVLRIVRVSPHGSDFRYDLEFVGLEPGEYDLRSALKRKDGTPLPADGTPGALPALPVRVKSLLAPGIVKPHAPEGRALQAFGGYRAAMILVGSVWVAGLALILFGWRKRRQAEVAAARPPTLAERLRPLVERALAGELSGPERSRLEGSLIAFWRRKLDLEEERPAALVARLRAHPEAGPLLASLEAWLHMPVPPRNVDVAALLAPYKDLPADALPEPDSGSRAASGPGSRSSAPKSAAN